MVGSRIGLGLSAVLPIFIVSLFLIPTGVTWSETTTPTLIYGQVKDLIGQRASAEVSPTVLLWQSVVELTLL